MALSPTVVWEVRTTGSDGNGGGFNSAAAGTDRSQQDAAFVTIDGVVITATVNAVTNILDITGYTPVAADVGNLVNVTGGTATAGVYQIISIPGAGQWEVDRAVGNAGDTATGAMGGANATPGWVSGKHVDQNVVWIRSGTYTINSAVVGVSGGLVRPVRGKWEGYESARGDLGAAPVLLVSGIDTVEVVITNGSEVIVANLEVDGASLVSIRGFRLSARGMLYRCVARRCTNGGVYTAGATDEELIASCRATECSTQPAFDVTIGGVPPLFYGCQADNNSVTGFAGIVSKYVRCVSNANSGATSHGFLMNRVVAINCNAYGNGGDGFNNAAGVEAHYINCISEGNTGFGYRTAAGGVGSSGEARINSAAFNNTAGNTSGLFRFDVGFITGTSTFFTNAAGGDFSLNTAAGGGNLLRGEGDPVTFIDGLSTEFLDIGAVQTSGLGGGGGGGGNIPFVTLGESWG
jgi:hypothetical protein